MAVLNVPPSVREYLQRLEVELKKIPGPSPEEALADAREYLLADYEALRRSGEVPKDAEHMQWICDRYGKPSEVASQYAAASEPAVLPPIGGYAPGWRICCTGCGRSAPLAAMGAIRVGARSYHKYTWCYCRQCKRLKACRIIQDLNETNLTQQLCNPITTDELRSRMHRPIQVIVGILAMVLVSLCLFWLLCFGLTGFP